jgi:hypothetical protein
MFARLAVLSVALLAVSAAFAADDKPKDKAKEKEKPKKAAPFEFPLKIGTVWTYRVGDNNYLLKAAKLEKVGGQECVRMEMLMKGNPVSHEHLAVARVPAGHKEEGTMALMRYSFEGKEAKPPIPILLLPEDKKAWSVASTIRVADGTQKLVGTFRKAEEDIKVLGKEYKKALRVTADNLNVNGVNLNITYYFVSGVGMVKQVAEIGEQKVTIELEKVVIPK